MQEIFELNTKSPYVHEYMCFSYTNQWTYCTVFTYLCDAAIDNFVYFKVQGNPNYYFFLGFFVGRFIVFLNKLTMLNMCSIKIFIILKFQKKPKFLVINDNIMLLHSRLLCTFCTI